MKILIFKGESSYDALRTMADTLAHGFSDIAEVEVIDLLKQDSETLIRRLLRLDYHAIISFNAVMTQGISLPTGASSVPILSALPVPHICWMMDDLIYHYDRLKIKNDLRIVLSCSPGHADFLTSLESGAKHDVLLPGASLSKFSTKPHENRNFDCMVAASWMGEPDQFWLRAPEPIRSILLETVDRVEAGESPHVYHAIKDASFTRGIDLNVSAEIIPLLIAAENFLRMKERIEVIQSAARTGLRMCIFGEGWDGRGLKGNIRFFSSVTNEEALDFYEDSRLVLNLNARNGGSERLFNGLSRGAAVVSPYASQIASEIPDGLGVRYIKYPLIENLKTIFEEFKDPSLTEEMGQSGLVFLQDSHSWAHRAKRIMDLMSNYQIHRGNS